MYIFRYFWKKKEIILNIIVSQEQFFCSYMIAIQMFIHRNSSLPRCWFFEKTPLFNQLWYYFSQCRFCTHSWYFLNVALNYRPLYQQKFSDINNARSIFIQGTYFVMYYFLYLFLSFSVAVVDSYSDTDNLAWKGNLEEAHVT